MAKNLEKKKRKGPTKEQLLMAKERKKEKNKEKQSNKIKDLYMVFAD